MDGTRSLRGLRWSATMALVSPSESLALVILTLAAGGVVAAAVLIRRDDDYLSAYQTPLPLPAPNPQVRHGLSITEKGLSVDNWGEWMAFAPDAVQRAIEDGARGADGVLVHVMRRVFPHAEWPPRETDVRYPQWRSLVGVIASTLQMDLHPDPQSTRRLELVQ